MRVTTEQTCMEKLDVAVNGLIFALSSRSERMRQNVRRFLVTVGEPAVGALMGALRDENTNVRLEAVKALAEIVSTRGAPALVAELADDDEDVRWIASEGLVALRRDGLIPLLGALAANPDAPLIREGAHHVLSALLRDPRLFPTLKPVMDALNVPGANVDVVARSNVAIDRLEHEEGIRTL